MNLYSSELFIYKHFGFGVKSRCGKHPSVWAIVNFDSSIIVNYLLLALLVNVGTDTQTEPRKFLVSLFFSFISLVILYWHKLQDFIGFAYYIPIEMASQDRHSQKLEHVEGEDGDLCTWFGIHDSWCKTTINPLMLKIFSSVTLNTLVQWDHPSPLTFNKCSIYEDVFMYQNYMRDLSIIYRVLSHGLFHHRLDFIR